METNVMEKPLIKDLNEHIVCPLCRGYLIDATTLVECLHSFCRGCIVRRLSSGARACPVCNIATSPPLLPDTKLQRLVYLLVPGLFRSELERRRHFRLVNPQCPPLPSPLGSLDLTLDDLVSLSLRELTERDNERLPKITESNDHRRDNTSSETESEEETTEGRKKKQDSLQQTGGNVRYLKCPAGVTVRHLIRLLMLKRGWEDANNTSTNGNPNVVSRIEMFCHKKNDEDDDRRSNSESYDRKNLDKLDQSWTLFDLAFIFGWKREAPMRLFYRVLRKDEIVQTPKPFPILNESEKQNNNPIMENIQRPPTPPPSPKSIQVGANVIEVPRQQQQQQQQQQQELSRVVEHNALLNNAETSSSRTVDTTNNVSVERDKATKAKKPRCEVTPVLRAPEAQQVTVIPVQQQNQHNHPVGPAAPSESSKRSKELSRLEHRKRRKRRNKRVIAEITTTPREDLLKLKVRLTPCPPRITSSGGNGQTKEKLLQMRAVRREKIKANNQRNNTIQREENANLKDCIDPDETIEEIIDAIPDEVVRIAQNMGSPSQTEDSCKNDKNSDQRTAQQINSSPPSPPSSSPSPLDSLSTIASSSSSSSSSSVGKDETVKKPDTPSKSLPELCASSSARPKKDEEILRRLGLVAIGETNGTREKGGKQRTSNGPNKSNDREKLEKQLRESKANRVRSLLAEKQMRDALRSIMSKTKGEEGSIPSKSQSQITSSSGSSSSSSSSSSGGINNPPNVSVSVTSSGGIAAGTTVTTMANKKKGPPPLAPLRVTNKSSSYPVIGTDSSNNHPKYEKPLDLSNGSVSNDNILDLSASLATGGKFSTSLSSSSPTSSSSSPTTASSSGSSTLPSLTISKSSPSLSSSRPPPRVVIQTTDNLPKKSKDSEQLRGRSTGQDTNLRTLSDAAVSLLSGINDKIPTSPQSNNISVNKVALRIPQPHQRITGFGVKIKPNLGVRHIPNPQAVVASQYRNQRANFFNTTTSTAATTTVSAQQQQ